jgi:hypothetical protein
VEEEDDRLQQIMVPVRIDISELNNETDMHKMIIFVASKTNEIISHMENQQLKVNID